MKLTTNRTHAKIIHTLSVEDGPVIRYPYSTTGKEVRVDHVTIEYVLKDGRWAVDGGAFAIDLTGYALKKDGTDSKVRLTFHPQYWTLGSRTYAEEYRWPEKVVDLLRPEGVPTMTGLRRYEL